MRNTEDRNVCPECGGKLLIEAVGTFGDIYRMKKNGEMSKRRIARRIYDTTGGYLVYCGKCGAQMEAEDYGF